MSLESAKKRRRGREAGRWSIWKQEPECAQSGFRARSSTSGATTCRNTQLLSSTVTSSGQPIVLPQKGTYRPGDFILEAVRQWHMGAIIGAEPLKLLVIDIVEKGQTNTVLQIR
jgi:hypothetical protein